MFRDDIFTQEIQTIETDYITERGKPMPTRVHGKTQQEIGSQLDHRYRNQFNIESEVTLDTPGKSTTPDICIFPPGILDWDDFAAKTKDVPLTTIEIQSTSQSPEELVQKARDHYFPFGVKSAWVVVPALKAIQVILPGQQSHSFVSGELHDPATGIRIDVDKVFEKVSW